MHELALASSIAEAGQRELVERKLKRVTAMHVTVGGLSHVDPQNLVFCFEAAVKGTPLEGCELVVTKTGIGARCNRCGKEFSVTGGDFKCPSCGVADVELSGEGELTLTSIEAQTDDEEED
jgi:hydrogenase nickel incorporation protein HypA/HybF